MVLGELPDPPLDLTQRSLPIQMEKTAWYRLNPSQYPSALFFDQSGNGRYDGPHQGYGILYMGESEAMG